jgi:formylglycine-generating enzyme required for sulfatase activity
VTCVNWYQAYAFCIWDSGFLPSYNEFNYALMGGELERPYPWGSEPITPDRATYCSIMDCGTLLPSDVGSKPLGDGFFGQSDLVGSAWEWVLDGNGGAAVCKDCIFYDAAAVLRTCVGGAYNSPPDELDMNYMFTDQGALGNGARGFRCARSP